MFFVLRRYNSTKPWFSILCHNHIGGYLSTTSHHAGRLKYPGYKTQEEAERRSAMSGSFRHEIIEADNIHDAMVLYTTMEAMGCIT